MTRFNIYFLFSEGYKLSFNIETKIGPECLCLGPLQQKGLAANLVLVSLLVHVPPGDDRLVHQDQGIEHLLQNGVLRSRVILRKKEKKI